MSLAFEVWSLAVAEINEWPIFQARDQLLANGILQNVFRFLAPAFVLAQPVFKEIALPDDAEFLGRPFLPFFDDELQRFPGRWKGKQCVQVVRHEQEEMRPPQQLFLSMADGFK